MPLATLESRLSSHWLLGPVVQRDPALAERLQDAFQTSVANDTTLLWGGGSKACSSFVVVFDGACVC